MKNRILAVNLYNALKEVKYTKMHSLPILNHVLLDFSNGELHLTTTDLETKKESTAPCRMNEEFKVCINMITKCDVSNTYKPHWKKFYPFLDYIKLLAEWEEVLDFEYQENICTLVITHGRTRTEFKCMDAREFPSLETIPC